MREKKIGMIRKTMGKYPLGSYAAVVCTIQSEWIFLQRVTWYPGDEFAGVEKIIWETILPCLLLGETKTQTPIVGGLITMLVNKSGPGLMNPVTSEK